MPRHPFEFNGVVRITRIGAFYLVLTFFIAFAAVNTGNNSLYIGLSFMLSILILSGIASQQVLRKMQVEFLSADEVWAGRPVRGLFRVRSRSRIWNARDLLIVSPWIGKPVFIPLIRRNGEREVTAELLFERRGRTNLARVDIYTRYPFGLFLKKRRQPIGGELIVFPRLLDQMPVSLTAIGREGDAAARRARGSGTEFHSLRDYARGDSPRLMHWKKSASLGRLLLRETQAETKNELVVAIDPYLPSGTDPEQFEQMVAEAATVIHQALEEGWRVTLLTPGRGRASGDGERGRRNVFEILALIEPSSTRWQGMPAGAVVFSVTNDAQVA
jgi:uncharacterized protein (DUF58 family)